MVADTSSLPSELKRLCLEEKEDGMGALLEKLVANYGKYGKRYGKMRARVLDEFSGRNSDGFTLKYWENEAKYGENIPNLYFAIPSLLNEQVDSAIAMVRIHFSFYYQSCSSG